MICYETKVHSFRLLKSGTAEIRDGSEGEGREGDRVCNLNRPHCAALSRFAKHNIAFLIAATVDNFTSFLLSFCRYNDDDGDLNGCGFKDCVPR